MRIDYLHKLGVLILIAWMSVPLLAADYSVKMRLLPYGNNVSCPKIVWIYAHFTAKKKGLIKYVLARKGIGLVQPRIVVFEKPGSKTVKIPWLINLDIDGAEKNSGITLGKLPWVQIIHPIQTEPVKAVYSLRCKTEQIKIR